MSETEFKRECDGLMRDCFTHGILADMEDSLRKLLGRGARGTPGPTTTTHAKQAGGMGELAEHEVTTGAPHPLLPPSSSSSTTTLNLKANTLQPLVVKRAVTATLDRGAREREMLAQLLTSTLSHPSPRAHVRTSPTSSCTSSHSPSNPLLEPQAGVYAMTREMTAKQRFLCAAQLANVRSTLASCVFLTLCVMRTSGVGLSDNRECWNPAGRELDAAALMLDPSFV